MAQPVYEYKILQGRVGYIEGPLKNSAADGWIYQSHTTTFVPNDGIHWSVIMYRDVQDV